MSKLPARPFRDLTPPTPAQEPTPVPPTALKPPPSRIKVIHAPKTLSVSGNQQILCNKILHKVKRIAPASSSASEPRLLNGLSTKQISLVKPQFNVSPAAPVPTAPIISKSHPSTHPSSVLKPPPIAPKRKVSTLTPPKILKISASSLLKPPLPPPNTKLFILKNGELKTIKKSNISTSGIIKFIPNQGGAAAASTTTPSESPSRPPMMPPFRPISSSYIVNNDIQGGVMTMEQYRHQVDSHRKNQILEQATKSSTATIKDPVTIYKVIRPNDIDLDAAAIEAAEAALQAVPKKNKPGRKKGVTNKKVENVSSILEPVPSGARTRSGRVSRPPRHIQRFYMKDTDGCSLRESIYLEDETVEELPMTKKQKRLIGGERLKCDQCGKSYANERMLLHHIQVAHEMVVPGEHDHLHRLENDNLRIDCFNFLLGRLKKVPIKLRGKVFLDEMEIFVKKMHKLMEKLIRRKTEGFLNYSQVHQVPNILESLLNVPAGQYHFDTQVIDGDEKTILSDGNKENEESGNSNSPRNNPTDQDQNTQLVVGQNESALSGFDDSSTQPTLINHTQPPPPDNGDDNAKESSSFAHHIISLEDAIYGPEATEAGEGGDLLSGSGGRDGGYYRGNDEDDEDYEEEEQEEDDDLTTPKKAPQPSSSARRLKKLKRVIKNLSDSNSYPEVTTAVAGKDHHHQDVMLQEKMSHGAGAEVQVINRPVIKDLSMELFRSPDIGCGSSRRGTGPGTAGTGAGDASGGGPMMPNVQQLPR